MNRIAEHIRKHGQARAGDIEEEVENNPTWYKQKELYKDYGHKFIDIELDIQQRTWTLTGIKENSIVPLTTQDTLSVTHSLIKKRS